MKLDRTTYEIYLMDYLDGRLDAVEVSELLLFLEQNPDLKEEFEGVASVRIPEGPVSRFDSSSLKKASYEQVKGTFDELLVAQMEGDLTAGDEARLSAAFKLYPQLLDDRRAFALTRMEPDLSVRFERKSQLKVFTLAPYYKRMAGVAAAILLLTFVGIYFSRVETTGPVAGNAIPQHPGVPHTTIPDPAQQLAGAGHYQDDEPASVQIPAKKSTRPSRPHKEAAGSDLPGRSQAPAIAYIQPRREAIPVTRPVLLPVQEAPPRYIVSAVQPSDAGEYLSVGAWLKRKLIREADPANRQGIVGRINRVTHADIVIEKDTATGRITRFEIAGIGLVNH